MAPSLYSNNNHVYQQQQQQNHPDSAFPMLVITVLSIIATAFLLLAYYIFVIKCCSSNWDRLLRRLFSVWRARRNQDDDPFIALSPTMWMNHGLDQSVIHQIPTFQYKKRSREGDVQGQSITSTSIYGCVVCLNEFQEQDMLRVLPSCSHAFHLDCIDVWLQSNSNCPLCRSSISGVTRCPFDQIIAPSSSPQGSVSYSTTDSLMGGDEDFVVIELGGHGDGLDGGVQERDASRELLSSSVLVQPRSCQSPRKLEKKVEKGSKLRKRSHVSIMGDECIDVREKDDQFCIEPIRRSFSLDSATGRQLYLTVKTIVQQTRQEREVDFAQECGRRVRRSSHSFRHVQGSRNAVFPI